MSCSIGFLLERTMDELQLSAGMRYCDVSRQQEVASVTEVLLSLKYLNSVVISIALLFH